MDMIPYRVVLPSQEGAAQSTSVANFRGAPSPLLGEVYPASFGDEWFEEASPPQGGIPQPSFTVNQTIVNNDGCNFGTIARSNRYDTQLAVESAIIVAEQRHQVAIAHMAERANLALIQQMMEMRREATEALAKRALRPHRPSVSLNVPFN